MNTEFVRINGDNNDAGKIRDAVEIIENGGLVAFPTETVYGIACAAAKASIGRLDQVKGRAADKRYTLHIGTKQQLDQFVKNVNIRGRKLIEKTWPGPVTVVFPLDRDDLTRQKDTLSDEAFSLLYNESTLGVRCPDNSIAADLLSGVSLPVVAPSANRSGNPPAVTADEVLAEFDGLIDMILAPCENIDRARNLNQLCKYSQSSTVVRLAQADIEVLREGVFSENALIEISTVAIMFVCTGNTCRSPMAELFCKQYLAEKLNCGIDELDKKGYKIFSAGVASCSGMSASDEVINVCRTRNIDATGHQSSIFDCEDAKMCDFIFAMTENHLAAMIERCPEISDKCLLLESQGGIGDPFGGNEQIYEQCAARIETALKRRLDEVLK